MAFRGSQPAIVDMMGGQVSAVSAPVGEFLPHMKTGKVRILATSGTQRTRFAPDVPTFTEQGHREMEATEPYGVFLPVRRMLFGFGILVDLLKPSGRLYSDAHVCGL